MNVDADPQAELVRDYLERLRATAAGLPPDRREELLAEVREHIGAAPWGGLEVAALVTLGVGGIVLPVFGLLLGLLLAWLSDRWSTQQKLVASAIALLPTVLLIPVVLVTSGPS